MGDFWSQTPWDVSNSCLDFSTYVLKFKLIWDLPFIFRYSVCSDIIRALYVPIRIKLSLFPQEGHSLVETEEAKRNNTFWWNKHSFKAHFKGHLICKTPVSNPPLNHIYTLHTFVSQFIQSYKVSYVFSFLSLFTCKESISKCYKDLRGNSLLMDYDGTLKEESQ